LTASYQPDPIPTNPFSRHVMRQPGTKPLIKLPTKSFAVAGRGLGSHRGDGGAAAESARSEGNVYVPGVP